MSKENTSRQVIDDATEKQWGRANPLRGANHVDTAIMFLAEHPIGSSLSLDAFDAWAHRHGLLNVPTGAPKKSDAWKAHLHRRHELKYSINKAASHPRMDNPFVIEHIAHAGGLLEVRTPQLAIGKSNFLRKMETICITKRRQLSYLMQSADWSALPPQDRLVAETIHDDIEMFQKKMELEAFCLNNKFAKLERKLRKAVESGELRPNNGGIREIISQSHSQIESSDHES